MSQNFFFNVMSMRQGEWKGERENDQERILNSMVILRGEMFFYPFSILILFSCKLVFAKYGEIW